jgi:hypothetical protein
MPVSSIKILSTITHPSTDQYATAADTTLTLVCQGTTTVTTMEGAKPEPVSMGLIVNFTKNTVHGFGHPGWFSGWLRWLGWASTSAMAACVIGMIVGWFGAG